MANTTFNTRIQSKYDLFANWTSQNPRLLAGELAVVVIPSESGVAANEPTILFKVGDGEKNFNDLSWASSLAGDVYGWAKAATKPSYTADEIKGLDAFIAGEIEDTDTQYRIVKVDDYNYKLQKKNKGEADTAFTDVPDGAIVIPKYDDSEVKANITSLETLVGSTSVATQISNAITALNLAETYDTKGAAAQALSDAKTYTDELANGTVATNASEIEKLKQADADNLSSAKEYADTVSGQALADAKTYVDGKDEAIAAAKKAGDDAQTAADAAQETADQAQTAADAAQADVDILAAKIGTVSDGQTVMDIIQNIQENAYDDTQIKADIKTNTDAIDAIETDYLKTADKTELTEAIATAKQEAIEAVLDGVTDDFDTLKEVAAWIQSDTTASAELVTRVSNIEADYLRGADKSALQAEIDILEKLIGELPADSTSTTVIAYIQEVVDSLKIGDYAKASDLTALADRVTILEGKAHTHDNGAVLNGITAEKVSNWDTAEQNAKDYADDLNTAMDTRVKAVEEEAHTHENADVLAGITAEKVTSWNKVSEKANNSDLAVIAKTGNVNDLIQTSGDVIIFNCGSASDNI